MSVSCSQRAESSPVWLLSGRLSNWLYPQFPANSIGLNDSPFIWVNSDYCHTVPLGGAAGNDKLRRWINEYLHEDLIGQAAPEQNRRDDDVTVLLVALLEIFVHAVGVQLPAEVRLHIVLQIPGLVLIEDHEEQSELLVHIFPAPGLIQRAPTADDQGSNQPAGHVLAWGERGSDLLIPVTLACTDSVARKLFTDLNKIRS